MFLLDGVARHYDWGSTDAIPALLGRDPDGRPWAELWFGAHASAPSPVHLPDGSTVGLDELIARDPAGMLGATCVERLGPTLPFLVKLLAAAQPLSLQVHPSRTQAVAGYDAEDAAGVALDAPTRTYRDRNHKPELLVALTPFAALAGFRAPAESAAQFERFDAGEPWVSRLRAGDLDGTFWALWDLDPVERAALVARVVAAASRSARDLPEADMVTAMAALHPGDIGLVVALLLNRVMLTPGAGLYAPAGRLHAYLDGLGIEVMANSDNVVRGGLTTKAVNLAELRRILEVRPDPAESLPPGADGRFLTPAEDFVVDRLVLEVGAAPTVGAGGRVGPDVVVCTSGAVSVTTAPVSAAAGPEASITLQPGGAAFLPHAAGPYVLTAGSASVCYRITTNVPTRSV